MKIEEPKVEFVEVDTTDTVCASGGSMDTCQGPDARMNNCSTMATDGYMNG